MHVCRLCSSCFVYTVEPPNKGHFGGGDFVLYLEAVLWWEVRIIIASTIIISIGAVASVLYIEVVLWWEGPLLEAPLYSYIKLASSACVPVCCMCLYSYIICVPCMSIVCSSYVFVTFLINVRGLL